MKFPPPDKEGVSEDGWESRIWKRGSFGMRMRRRGGEHEMNEFEGGRSVRLVVGSEEFCRLMAERWFARLEASSKVVGPSPTEQGRTRPAGGAPEKKGS